MQTLLLPAVLEYFDVPDLNRLMFKLDAEHVERRVIANLARVVTSIAAEGDPTALDIINRAVDQLVEMVEAVYKKLQFMSDPVPVCLSGGLSNAGAVFLTPLESTLAKTVPGCQLAPARLEAVDGALLLAARLIDPSLAASVGSDLVGHAKSAMVRTPPRRPEKPLPKSTPTIS